ncbi:MAG: hypothetical protein Q8N85_01410, partial [Candidatus Omnitrophota bacterium]|nr:hypothetical protein [Candidatus Omnitrophota bacterium]
KKFSEGTKEEISKICPGIMWNVLSESDNDIIYEWSIQSCAGQSDQHEIARTLSGADGIYVLHYVTKKVPISSERREEWVRLLKLYVVK